MSNQELEMPELDGELEDFKFYVLREEWFRKTGAYGRPLTVAVIPKGTVDVYSSTPKAYAYDNAASILRAAKRAKKQAEDNIRTNRAKKARYGKWEGSYPPKKISEV